MEHLPFLEITAEALEGIRRHSERDYPREACGFLLGRRSPASWRADTALASPNLAPPGVRDRFEIDPEARRAAEAVARAQDLEIVGFYHSHPDHGAHFSSTDREGSEEVEFGEPWLPPTYAYLVVSVMGGRASGQTAFAIREGQAAAIEIRSR